MSTVHVIAIVTAKAGKRAELLQAFQANVPNVHAEEGCIEYVATVDAEGARAASRPGSARTPTSWSRSGRARDGVFVTGRSPGGRGGRGAPAGAP